MLLGVLVRVETTVDVFSPYLGVQSELYNCAEICCTGLLILKIWNLWYTSLVWSSAVYCALNRVLR